MAPQTIGYLWQTESSGLYSNSDFETLYKAIGHNNGNLAFVHSIRSHLTGNVRFYPWHVRPDQINSRCDIVVVPSANQLGKHTDLGTLAETFSKVDKPIISIGLGAQADNFDSDVELSEGTARWLDVLIENGQRHGIRNIYARGPFTAEQIKKRTGVEVVVGGCPSFFMNPRPNLGKIVARNWKTHPLPRSIAVAAGHQSWRQTRTIEHQLVSMMMHSRFPGVYIVQSMGDMIKSSRGLFDDIAPETLQRLRDHAVPELSIEEYKGWALQYCRSYYDIPAWMDELRRHDLVIGPRYHGTAIALQAGRMGCTIAFDSRTEEMCVQTAVPYLRAADLADKPLTRETLVSLIQFDPVAYDRYRLERAAHYVEFLRGAGLTPAPFLANLAEQHTAVAA